MACIFICILALAIFSPISLHAQSNQALLAAAANGDSTQVKKLVTTSNVNIGNSQGQTALHFAVANFKPTQQESYLKVIRILLKNGAKPYLQNNESSHDTPMSIAQSRIASPGYKEIVEILDSNEAKRKKAKH